MKRFSVPWGAPSVKTTGASLPILPAFVRAADGKFHREIFIVDSGADTSLAPRSLANKLNINWETGEPARMTGISPLPECVVDGRIHLLELFVREVGTRLTIPFCFAEGDAPFLLGREGFFDAFRITFDMRQQLTTFTIQHSK